MDSKATRSKIGRLPWCVRNKLNERLRDGVGAQKLLPWLNRHIKAPDSSITASNVSDWRKTGYRAWLEERAKVAYLRDFTNVSEHVASATEGNPAVVAARLLAKHVLGVAGKLAQGDDIDANVLSQLTKAIGMLNSSEAEARKLDIQNKRVELKEEEMLLNKAKFRRQSAELFLEWLEDREVVAIAKGGGSREDKIAKILEHMDKMEAVEDEAEAGET